MPGGWRTEKQAAVLRKNGLNPEVPFDVASQQIDQLKRNGWGKGGGQPQYGTPQYPQGSIGQQYVAPPQPNTGTAQYAPQGQYQYQQPQQQPGACTQKQAAILAKYGYPTNVSFDTASQIIDQLKANNWQPVNGATPQPHQAQTYANSPPQYAPPAPSYPPQQTQQFAPPPAAPAQFAPPPAAPAQYAQPQVQNGQNAPWEGQPQFSGVPNFG